jgi:NAD(P) transhydrogenase
MAVAVQSRTYDLIVLGGGPAGIVGAATAIALGKSVALIENQKALGGAGINTGTVPSKTLRETSLTLSGARARKLHGVDLSLHRGATVDDFLRHQRAVKTSLNAMLREQFDASNADVYHGTGQFEDPHTIRILKGQGRSHSGPGDGKAVDHIRASHILIATGSSPVRPDIFPFDGRWVYDSDTILHLHELPKKMAVVGAGTIGCEYACIFAALQKEVHVVDGRGSLLPFLDAEIALTLTAAMRHSGIIFHWNERVQACRATRQGGVELMCSSGASLKVDTVMVTAGRKGNTERLNLAAAGLTAGQRGLIAVNEHYQTQVSHIHAAGDVIGSPALASTGMDQARHAMRHAFAEARLSGAGALLPTGIYTIPEIGMIGETEEDLKRKSVPYVAGRAPYNRNARGRIIGDSDGVLKLLFHRSDLKLLGVHVIGEQATELVHIGMIGMLCNATACLFDEACFNIPTLGQLYKLAALDAIRHA